MKNLVIALIAALALTTGATLASAAEPSLENAPPTKQQGQHHHKGAKAGKHHRAHGKSGKQGKNGKKHHHRHHKQGGKGAQRGQN